MFRKLVSSLSFSPALVGQLGFYARRLRREEVTRKLGLIFTVLALIVQSFAVFSPPESANASSAGDLINGGVSSLGNFLNIYDSNSNNIKDIYTSAGITRQEIASAQYTTINSKQWITHGRTDQFSAAQGQRTFTYYKNDGSSGSIYARPLSLWDTTATKKQNGSTYYAWVGHSAKIGDFAITKHCGNLDTKNYLPPATPPTCPTGTIGTPPKCTTPPAPASTCNNLLVSKISRTSIKLTANASVANGASVSGYTFIITDNNGVSVYSKDIASTAKTVSTDTITLSKSGRYKASTVVHTSLGDRTQTNCSTVIAIESPGKCPLNPDITIEDSECQPCPGNPDLWVKDEDCRAKIIATKTAKNLTQNLNDASTAVVNESDKIQYTLTVKNVGNLVTEAPIVENLGDVLEYAQLVDNGGGTLNEKTDVLSWSPVVLKPNESQTRAFLVQLVDTIPTTPQGQSDKISYDCRLTNTFGNTVNINVNCPTEKLIETVVAELPQTGARENLIFAGVILSIVTFFYARARQMKKEVRLIRRDLNSGTI